MTLALYLAASVAAPALMQVAAPTAPTVQQQFQAATALAEQGKHAEAVAAWNALLPRVTKNRRSTAIMRVRKSQSLFALRRYDESAAEARAGLADLSADDASLRSDRYVAYANLGAIARDTLDYPGAADAYAAAEASADQPGAKAGAAIALASVAIFVDPSRAAAALDRADALVAGNAADKAGRAAIARQRGLLLLNGGDFAGARKQSAEAVALLGGMTSRTDLRDAAARSDTAIASLLGGNEDEARKYMAMSGAGRFEAGNRFSGASEMIAPDCGGDMGLRPEDVAVVEFAIGDDGTVVAATPVYAAGGGKVALEFARVARGWTWTPQQVKELPLFFRYSARVEMRCSTGFERPSLTRYLRGELATWLDGKGVRLADGPVNAPAQLAAQRQALDAAGTRNGANALALVASLYALVTSPLVGIEETHVLAQRALAIADAAGAPPLPRLALDLNVRLSADADAAYGQGRVAAVRALVAEPRYTGDAQARAVLRLMLADAMKPGSKEARAVLAQVADDAALPVNDPLKVGALVRVASANQIAGDTAAAKAAFERSGLAPSQCALIDAPPQLVKYGGTFPQEAMVWGFDGWTRMQFDVAADGRVANARPIISYPPFVFSKAARQGMLAARYTKTYRPDGSPGCGGIVQSVRFTRGG